jgi:site-specific DNA-adenine methylase
MKNHFIFSYVGNKREEVEIIYKSIEDKLEGIETICEPFCGTSAFSYYISTLHPRRFNYVLNDMDENLIQLYNILKSEEETLTLIDQLKKLYHTHNKELYKSIIGKRKDDSNFIGFCLSHISYSMTSGLFDSRTNSIESVHNKFDRLKTSPIVHFLRTENVLMRCGNGLDIYKEYCGNSSYLIFLDPPYLISDNTSYGHNNQSIYEHFYYSGIRNENAFIVLCLEYSWIVKLLFPDTYIIYPKRYTTISKKKTEHTIIINRN